MDGVHPRRPPSTGRNTCTQGGGGAEGLLLGAQGRSRELGPSGTERATQHDLHVGTKHKASRAPESRAVGTPGGQGSP